jgi:hypothetical protein
VGREAVAAVRADRVWDEDLAGVALTALAVAPCTDVRLLQKVVRYK